MNLRPRRALSTASLRLDSIKMDGVQVTSFAVHVSKEISRHNTAIVSIEWPALVIVSLVARKSPPSFLRVRL